jgi:hypothetical protein
MPGLWMVPWRSGPPASRWKRSIGQEETGLTPAAAIGVHGGHARRCDFRGSQNMHLLVRSLEHAGEDLGRDPDAGERRHRRPEILLKGVIDFHELVAAGRQASCAPGLGTKLHAVDPEPRAREGNASRRTGFLRIPAEEDHRAGAEAIRARQEHGADAVLTEMLRDRDGRFNNAARRAQRDEELTGWHPTSEESESRSDPPFVFRGDIAFDLKERDPKFRMVECTDSCRESCAGGSESPECRGDPDQDSSPRSDRRHTPLPS